MGRCIQHAALVWMTCMAGCDPAPSAPLLADAAPPEAGQPSDADPRKNPKGKAGWGITTPQ